MGTVVNFVILVASGALAAYLFYGLASVSPEIEQQDQVVWMYAKRKYIRGLAVAGEYLGLGDRLVNARALATKPLFSFHLETNWSGVKVEDDVFDGVPVRIYQALTPSAIRPALVWIHGGGWVTKAAKSDDFLMAELVRRLGIVIVSIDYRLAPEFPYPVPFEDCEQATVYFMEHADKWGVDPSRIALGGASAGGNLAAAVSLKLRDDKRPLRPRLQLLIVPCLQAFDLNTPSYQESEDNSFLPKYWMTYFWLWYAFGWDSLHLADDFNSNMHTSSEAKHSKYGEYTSHDLVPKRFLHTFYRPSQSNFGNATLWSEVKSVIADPYFAPLMAKQLAQLPKAYIATAHYDVLRDDGVMFAKRLEAAGVEVKLAHYDKGFHAMVDFFESLELSKAVLNDIVVYLGHHL